MDQVEVEALYRCFKEVTALSPLQYQKRLRLQEARRLMLGKHVDAAEASFRVGYESPTQLSREYRRLFGAPLTVISRPFDNAIEPWRLLPFPSGEQATREPLDPSSGRSMRSLRRQREGTVDRRGHGARVSRGLSRVTRGCSNSCRLVPIGEKALRGTCGLPVRVAGHQQALYRALGHRIMLVLRKSISSFSHSATKRALFFPQRQLDGIHRYRRVVPVSAW